MKITERSWTLGRQEGRGWAHKGCAHGWMRWLFQHLTVIAAVPLDARPFALWEELTMCVRNVGGAQNRYSVRQICQLSATQHEDLLGARTVGNITVAVSAERLRNTFGV